MTNDVPDIVDFTQTPPPIAPENADLFDDQPLQQYAPPPVPRTTHFYKLDKRLQSLDTKILYIGIPGSAVDGGRAHWDLHGPRQGYQGLMLAPQVSGIMHLPFQQLVSEGPYQVGGIYERTDWRKREIGFGVMVNVGWGPDTSYRYRMLEERWWRSWSATQDGWFGIFTRTHGWRWVKVRLAEEPKDAFALDPTAMDNNFQQWSMTAVALDPYFYKRKLVRTWKNAGANGNPPPGTPWQELTKLIENVLLQRIPGLTALIPGQHIGEGIISVYNRGDLPAWPLFIVSAPGKAWIQDGPGGPMVECPLLTSADGYTLIDTDPIKRTATSATDVVDPLFYRILRNSQLLDFLLHDLTSTTLPVWRRMDRYFQVPWPARTIANIRVQHSQPGATITCLMPQRYAMGFA